MVSLSFTKCCIALKIDGLNFDGLAGKRQKRQNFPLSKFPAIQYIASYPILGLADI